MDGPAEAPNPLPFLALLYPGVPVTRLKSLCALFAGVLAAGCTGSGTTVTILGYAVVIKTAPPGSAQAGTAIPIAFTVNALQSDGTSIPAAGKSVTVSVTAGGGTIGGGSTATLVSAADGSIAATWLLGAAAGTQTLRGSVSATEFLDINVTATSAPATQLAITTQPAVGATAGTPLSVQPTVQLRTAGGVNAAQAGVVVTISIATGGGTVGGTTTATTDANGAAAFTNVSVGGTTGNVTLRFSAVLGGVTVTATSGIVAVAAAPWAQLAITTQPAATATGGVLLTRQPIVQLKDANGINASVVGVPVTVSIASGTGTIGGTAITLTDATGSAAFTDLFVNGPTSTVTLRFAATAGGTPVTVTSSGVAVTAPNQVTIVTAPPSAAGNGVALFTQPTAQLVDGSGLPLHQAGVPITVSVATGIAIVSVVPGSAGTLTVSTDVNGIAAFHDVMLTGVGVSTLRFAAPGFAPATSGNVSVVVAPAAITLSNSLPLGPLIANSGELSYYAFSVPANTLTLEVVSYGGTGNIELYVRRGLNPTATDFDCKASVAGPAQICTLGSNPTGQYFVVVKAASGYSGAMVRANAYNAGCIPKANLTLAVAVNATLSLGTGCLVEQQQTLHDRYTIVIPVTQAVTITSNTSSNLLTNFIAWRLPDAQVNYYGQPIGVAPVTTFPIIWGPGTYTVMVGDASGTGEQRNYSLRVDATPAQPAGCSTILAYGPVNTSLALTNGDCPGTAAGTFSHRIALLVSPGQTVTVTMASAAFDPVVRLLAGLSLGAGTVIAQDDNGGGGTSARLVFTNTDANSNSQFTLEFTSAVAAAVGSYAFTVTTTPPIYNLRQPSSRIGPTTGPTPASGPLRVTPPRGP